MQFELDDDEKARFTVWKKKHLDEHHGGELPYTGAIGGLFTFKVTPTSLGTILAVECGMCRMTQLRDRVMHAATDTSGYAAYSETLTDFGEW